MAAVLATFAAHAQAQNYAFTTLAGDAGYSSKDGTGNGARFLGPTGVAVDAGGNLYVADSGNNTIRKITPAGVVSTLAGKAGYAVSDDGLASAGSADGVGSWARFSHPTGVAVDQSGNVYVADGDNRTIRKITAGGVVTTFAGLAGSSGSADGTGSAARFNAPSGVAVDTSGTVYVADSFTIRKITTAGVVTTLAGSAGNVGTVDGVGSAARFGSATALAVDSSGNVFVADVSVDFARFIAIGATVRKITPGGVVTTLAGASDGVGAIDGSGSTARFNSPRGVTVDGAGNVYVGDSLNNTIRKISAGGVVTTLAGQAGAIRAGTDGAGSAARFNSPAGLAVDGAGNIFVADSLNTTIRKITADGVVTTVAGSADLGTSNAPNLNIDGIGSAARFNVPTGVAVDAGGNVFVADGANRKIRKVSASGVVTTMAVSDGGGNNQNGLFLTFFSPSGVALDRSGNLLVSDGSAIRRIAADGVATTLAGSTGPGSGIGNADGAGSAARFFAPNGLAIDGSGNVFVADSGNRTIRKITPAGIVTTLAGAGSFGSADGVGGAAQFASPSSVAVDGSGNVFVADRDNFTIRKVTAAGVVTTFAGVAGNQGGADGVGSVARFMSPGGIAIDSGGNLFVADATAIRRITAGGAVTTIGGKAGNRDSVDGTGSTARFGDASALAVDGAGNIYVTDSGFKTIRKGVPLANPARLIDVSVLATIAGGDTLTMGTIVGGLGTSGTKPLLVRVAGPSLVPFGVSGPLADPKFEFFTVTTKVNENDDWGGVASLGAAFGQVGAFPFASQTSKDAALVLPAVAFGNNTVRVSGNGAAGGTVLAELYDATPVASLTPTTPRLINVSLLKEVGAGMTAGFVIDGQGAKTLLIRAVGSSLAVFGVGGLLADPKLELFNGQSQSIATNDNWGDAGVLAAATLSAAFTQVGAFVLSGPASKDAALLVTLQPGNYTVQVRSADSTAGVALVEVYEVP